ncbi:MAG TPA: toll/interleukin-1 receptor domain-containing protein [Candidatus Cybelea sp.]|nr:toll/interleukin-1 receptor domain-containing protein [Candidatus Cybelea sp.]
MANPEHLRRLKEGVAAWNKWREESSHVIPDLNGATLSTAQLSGANLSSANLKHANLRRASLIVSNLSGAELAGADLFDTKLNHADFSRACLARADLSAANLSGSKLFASDLSGANLSGADLSGSDLSGANLRDANVYNTSFAKVRLDHTTFTFTSLKTARGLEACEHLGPSALDYHTLMISGPLPEAFLRGCGLPDEFIRYLPGFWNQPNAFYSCFISYSLVDKPFALRLHDALQARGIRCWLDEHPVLAGEQIHRTVDEGIRLWDKVLLCCTKDSLTSWWVDKEVEKALQKEEKISKGRGKEVLAIIPLNLDGHMFWPGWQGWNQQHLTSRMAPDFTGWEKDSAKFEEQLEIVINSLRADTSAREIPPKPRV